MSAPGPVLRYRDATVGYAAPVVAGADLAVGGGRIVGLIGPNGAGKTTLVRAVTGGSRVLAGDVSVAGRSVASYSRRDLARLVGVLPQAVPQTFAFPARQFVEMGRHPHVSRFGDLGPHDHAAVERAMALTDTAHLSDEPANTLSGGDLQRLTLAQALAQEPSVLLLDEPTSHLDLNHRLQVLDVVRSLADGGLAVLAVFHDLDMAARYSDELAVAARGALSLPAEPQEVLTEATLRDVFGVRAVIGSDPVTGAVQVLPVLRDTDGAPRRGVRVLLVSGSGSGSALMRRLVLEGFDLTLGALAEGDTDHAVARVLGLPMRALGSFGAMSAADEDAVSAACAEADVVVVVSTPFGPANLGNLRAVSRAGDRAVLVGDPSAHTDFSRGEARRMWDGMIADGAIACPDARGIVHCIERRVVGR